MRKQILLSDLLILKQIFFTENTNLVILDPDLKLNIDTDKSTMIYLSRAELEEDIASLPPQNVLVNFSVWDLSKYKNHDKIISIIGFNKRLDKTDTELFYVNNPDESLRWIFPAKNSNPVFLALYNSASLKATIFKKLIRSSYALGIKSWCASGSIFMYRKEKFVEPFAIRGVSFEEWAVFTGTVGADRKCIVTLSKEGACTHFVKVPITRNAQKLVGAEYFHLKCMADFKFEHIAIPEVRKNEDGIVLSNIRPNVFTKSRSVQAVHINAILELYEKTIDKKRLQEISAWKTIKKGMPVLTENPTAINDISREKLQAISEHVSNLSHTFESDDRYVVAFAHGDFTPWNMYCTESRLHLYDWELSVPDMPVLFDLFHFNFQNGILVERLKYDEIKKNIERCMEGEEMMLFLKAHKINWQKYYRFYVVYIICYYLPKYIEQIRLHQQVHWLLDTWEAAARDMSKVPVLKT